MCEAHWGEVVEWLKAPASKAGRRDERLESSNLSLSEVCKGPAVQALCILGKREAAFELERRSEAISLPPARVTLSLPTAGRGRCGQTRDF